MDEIQDYRIFIRNEFEKRREVNASYTLAQFATDLGLLPSRLSDILSGRQGLSEKRAEEVAKGLKLSADYRDLFINLVNAKHSRGNLSKQIAQKKLSEIISKSCVVLDEVNFKKICNWYHLAVLDLVCRYAKWSEIPLMAAYLGIGEEELRISIGLLLDLKLIFLDAERKFQRNQQFVTIANDQSCEALKIYHEEKNQLALKSIRQTPNEKIDFTSINLWLSDKSIKEINNKIDKFSKSLLREYSNYEIGHDLYSVNFSLFPLKAKFGKSK